MIILLQKSDVSSWEKKHGKRLTSPPFVCKKIEYGMYLCCLDLKRSQKEIIRLIIL